MKAFSALAIATCLLVASVCGGFDDAKSTLWGSPVAGGSAFLVATDEVPLNGIAVDGGDLFWIGARTTDHHGFVRRLAK